MIDFLKGTVTPKDWVAVAGVLGVTALIVAAFSLLIHSKQRGDVESVREEDQNVYSDLLRARRINDEIETLRSETRAIETLVQEFEERLPSTREIPTLLKEFEGMAAEEDIDVELDTLSRNRDERKETIPYSIVARGNYHQVVSFLNRLERFKRYLKISNLSIKPYEGGFAEARFTLNTYRFLQSTESSTDGAA